MSRPSSSTNFSPSGKIDAIADSDWSNARWKALDETFQPAFDPLGTPAGSIFPERLKLPLASEEVGGKLITT